MGGSGGQTPAPQSYGMCQTACDRSCTTDCEQPQSVGLTKRGHLRIGQVTTPVCLKLATDAMGCRCLRSGYGFLHQNYAIFETNDSVFDYQTTGRLQQRLHIAADLAKTT